MIVSLGTNPGLAALWEDERQRQRQRGLEPQITPPDSPGNFNYILTKNFSSHTLMERLKNHIDLSWK